MKSMKSLVEYLNESLLNEAFVDYDTALENVPAKMKDVEKLKVLIRKFTKFGEEEDYNDESNNYQDKRPYERLLHSLKNSCTEKQIETLNNLNKVSYSAPYEEKVSARMKYCDKMFALIKSSCDKDSKRYGYADYNWLITALVGCADYIENYSGLKPEDRDKYLGKLANKYNKVFGIDADGFTEISRKYNNLKVSINKALEAEAQMVDSVNKIKGEFKNHKYTIFVASSDSAASLYIGENSKYESLDDMYDKIIGNCTDSSFSHYSLDTKLRNLVKDGKVNALYLCSGYYCWGEDKNNLIPTFGYLDEIPNTEIFKISSYDSKYYYSGKLSEGKMYNTQGEVAYRWYDSLWSSHTRN